MLYSSLRATTETERDRSTMDAFSWIQMSSLLIVMLQFKGKTEEHQIVTAERGRDVTLPCKNVIQGQHNCNRTTWIFSNSSTTPAVDLFEHGKNKEDKPESDRLSLSADCFLVIKKVTDQDVGNYTCRQFKTATGPQEGPDVNIHLSVNNNSDIDSKMAASTSTTVMSTTRKSMTAEPTIIPTLKITNIWTTKEEVKTSEGTLRTNNQLEAHSSFIIVPVGLAVLLITVVVIVEWKKTKGNKPPQSDNTRLSFNPADIESGPGNSQQMAEGDDGISYASISFPKKTMNKAVACGDDDDDGDTVIYSTMKASFSSGGVPTDPSNLYPVFK